MKKACREIYFLLVNSFFLPPQIEEKRLYGCQVLEAVHKLMTLTVANVKQVLSR